MPADTPNRASIFRKAAAESGAPLSEVKLVELRSLLVAAEINGTESCLFRSPKERIGGGDVKKTPAEAGVGFRN